MKNRRVILTLIQMMGVVFSAALLCLGLYIYDFEGSGISLALAIVSVVNFLFVIIIIVAVDYNFSEFVCPNCGKSFKPKFREYMMGAHTMSARYLRCPECDKKSFCKVDYDKLGDAK